MSYAGSRAVTDRQTNRQTDYCNPRAHAPSVNKASLALYIARITVTRGWPTWRLQQRDQPEIQKEYCAVEFVSVIEASKLIAIKVESRSLTPSP